MSEDVDNDLDNLTFLRLRVPPDPPEWERLIVDDVESDGVLPP